MKFINRLLLVLSVQIPTSLAMGAAGYSAFACFLGTVFVGGLLLFSVQGLIKENFV